MRSIRPSQFVFCTCQQGAELALKREAAFRAPHLRLAFSRPGFVTFKLDEASDNALPELPHLTFARAGGWSLGKVGGDEMHALSAATWKLPAVTEIISQAGIDDLHVWQRDSALPGDFGFEPGPTALAAEVEQSLRGAAPSAVCLSQTNSRQRVATRRLGRVLDVVLVEPNQWWIGYHVAVSRTDRWPGGVAPIEFPDHAVSRAYLKMAEALAWSALPAKPGDHWVELGCAPGGASQALLDQGMRVTGIDPAEVDSVVLAHERFIHVQSRIRAVPRRLFRGIRWLAADMNAAPKYTLDAVEGVVTQRDSNLQGLLLTLKLPDWELAMPEQISEYVARIQSWGYQDVRLRQLAHNRRELCAVALRSRSQRRRVRAGASTSTKIATRTSFRRDEKHSRAPGPHFSPK